MDFQYTFRQAHQDRLEDAGIKRYGRPVNEGYIMVEQPRSERKSVAKQVKRVLLATAQLLIR